MSDSYNKAAVMRYRRKNPARFMVSCAMQRAKRSGVPFSISVEDVVIPERCPILGLKLKSGLGQGRQGPNEDSPSLDRIVPELGYVPGNVQVISALANKMKCNATRSQLITFAQWVLRDQM